MAGGEGRRARKAVNYAELADFAVDDDFADFRTSTKTEKSKDKENVEWHEEEEARQRTHSKDRHKDHKSHRDKDRHRDDRDRHRKDRDRHRRDRKDRDRHRSRDRDERRMREHRSERRDKVPQDSSKEERSSDSTCDSSSSQTVTNSPAINSPAASTTSPIVSPSRRNPKPRLSLEEKIFQRELEAVLELSKGDVDKTSATPDLKEQEGTKEAATLTEKKETETESSTRDECSDEGNRCVADQNTEPIPEASLPHKLDEPACMKEEEEEEEEEVEQSPVPTPTPPPALPNCKITKEPLPSTSTGKTAKRIRKTVVFKEDSDSDFGGFSTGVDAESEESDFMPSPKKRKKPKESKKTRNAKPVKAAAQKPSHKGTDQNTSRDLVLSPRTRPALPKENAATPPPPTPPPLPQSPPPSLKVTTTTSPELKPSAGLLTPPPPPKTTSASLKVNTSPELKASPRLHSPPRVKTTAQRTNITKPVKRASPSAPSSVPSPATVKVPFRSPLSASPNSSVHSITSPASSTGSMYRGTRLRLGLSRSANLKPLHPNVARRITD